MYCKFNLVVGGRVRKPKNNLFLFLWDVRKPKVSCAQEAEGFSGKKEKTLTKKRKKDNALCGFERTHNNPLWVDKDYSLIWGGGFPLRGLVLEVESAVFDFLSVSSCSREFSALERADSVYYAAVFLGEEEASHGQAAACSAHPAFAGSFPLNR
jgi:hypothetical protein